jgi:hypothetical protein
MKYRLLALAAFAVTSFQAHADVVALWDYSKTPTSTKQTQSANGASFATVGGITTSFVAGVTNQALNTATYAAQGAGNLTRGVQFLIDTTGYTDLVLTFAQRNSATASAWTTLQYTTDGSSWLTATSFQMPAAQATLFVSGLTYDFTNVVGVNNNENFGIRLLASFAPGTNAYLATGTGSTYGTAGTIRYDNLLLSGNAIPDVTPAVPEPQTYALMLAGIAAVGLIARRRRAR